MHRQYKANVAFSHSFIKMRCTLTVHQLTMELDYGVQPLETMIKTVNGEIVWIKVQPLDLDISNHVCFINQNHDRTRLTLSPRLLVTFQSSYFNRIVYLWNWVCKTASPNSFLTLRNFKNFLRRIYLSSLNSAFHVDMPCSWSLARDFIEIKKMTSQKLKRV